MILAPDEGRNNADARVRTRPCHLIPDEGVRTTSLESPPRRSIAARLAAFSSADNPITPEPFLTKSTSSSRRDTLGAAREAGLDRVPLTKIEVEGFAGSWMEPRASALIRARCSGRAWRLRGI